MLNITFTAFCYKAPFIGVRSDTSKSQAPVLPCPANVVQVSRKFLLKVIRIHQYFRDFLGLAPPQLLPGMFVAVRATDIFPNPAEAAAVPWRLRQMSGLGAVGKWSAPVEETVVLLVGGPPYIRESVRVKDVLDIDILSREQIEARMAMTPEELCSELAHLELRGWLPTTRVCQVVSAELRIGLAMELMSSLKCFNKDWVRMKTALAQSGIQAGNVAHKAAHMIRPYFVSQVQDILRFSSQPSTNTIKGLSCNMAFLSVKGSNNTPQRLKESHQFWLKGLAQGWEILVQARLPQAAEGQAGTQTSELPAQPVMAQQQPIRAQQQPVRAQQQQPIRAQQQPVRVQQQQPIRAQQQLAACNAHQQLIGAEHQPIRAQQQPFEAQQQPADALQQPFEAQQHPAEALQQPAEALQQPAEAQQQPVEAQQQPPGTLTSARHAQQPGVIVVTATTSRMRYGNAVAAMSTGSDSDSDSDSDSEPSDCPSSDSSSQSQFSKLTSPLTPFSPAAAFAASRATNGVDAFTAELYGLVRQLPPLLQEVKKVIAEGVRHSHPDMAPRFIEELYNLHGTAAPAAGPYNRMKAVLDSFADDQLASRGPAVFMTAGLQDVTADTAATVMASPFAIKFSNYAVVDPTQPNSHIWGCRTVVRFPKQHPNSFETADNLCMTGLNEEFRCSTLNRSAKVDALHVDLGCIAAPNGKGGVQHEDPRWARAKVLALLPEDRHVTLHKLEGCEVYAVHASRVTELANNPGMEVQAQLEQFKLTFRWWVVPSQQVGPPGDRLVISMKANHDCVDHHPDMAVNAVLHEAAFRFWVNADLPTEEEVSSFIDSRGTGMTDRELLAMASCMPPDWDAMAKARQFLKQGPNASVAMDNLLTCLPGSIRGRGPIQIREGQLRQAVHHTSAGVLFPCPEAVFVEVVQLGRGKPIPTKDRRADKETVLMSPPSLASPAPLGEEEVHMDEDRPEVTVAGAAGVDRRGRRIGQGSTSAPISICGYRGVSFFRRFTSRPWQAQIGYASKSYYLGSFVSREDAARAYNAAAVHIRGADCFLNSVVPVLPADGGQAIIAAHLPALPNGSRWTRDVAAQLEARAVAAAAAKAPAAGPEPTPNATTAAVGGPLKRRQRSDPTSYQRSKRPAC